MERRDFLLDPLLSEAPGHSFISSQERSGEDDDVKGRKLNEKDKQMYDKAKVDLDTLLPLTRPKHLTDDVNKNLDRFTVRSIGKIGCTALNSNAMKSFGGARSKPKSAGGGGGGGLCGCCSIFCGGKKVADSNTAPPVRGNFWDDNAGKWVEMNLYNELDDLRIKPEDDSDILGAARVTAETGGAAEESKDNDVTDTRYYDVLGLDSSATTEQIKHKYHALSKEIHPDKIGARNDEAAVAKFQELSEAYHVLTDAELRQLYDEKGLEGLSVDSEEISNPFSTLDPAMTYFFLYGSDKFYAYTGSLAAATAAEIEDTILISDEEIVTVQRRRCLRLASLLLEKIECYILGDEEGTIAVWKEDVEPLVEAKFGYEMLNLIGMVYMLSAAQYLSFEETGVGLPPISKWATSYATAKKLKEEKKARQKKNFFTGLSKLKALHELEKEIKESPQPDKKKRMNQIFAKEVSETVFISPWAVTVVDVTVTLHTACNMLFYDQYVDKDSRIRRAKAVEAIGNTFLSIERPEDLDDIDTPLDLFDIYAKGAFTAVVETIRGKDESKFKAKR